MKPVRTLELPKELVETLGKEWAGTYTIGMLDAEEYLMIGEELFQELRTKPDWKGTIPTSKARKRLVLKSVLHDGKPIPDDVFLPCKLYEILQQLSMPINELTIPEAQDLFLRSTTVKPPA
jgi:hypothetical protein